jgi:hypothetical protein
MSTNLHFTLLLPFCVREGSGGGLRRAHTLPRYRKDPA